jgi:hypothetical protein
MARRGKKWTNRSRDIRLGELRFRLCQRLSSAVGRATMLRGLSEEEYVLFREHLWKQWIGWWNRTYGGRHLNCKAVDGRDAE